MNVKLATTASVFGAALASMLVAPELQASIVNLSFSPGGVGYGSLGVILINEVGASFAQWNDGLGQQLFATGLSSIAIVRASQTLSPGTFGGTYSLYIPAGGAGSSSIFVGFRFGGNVGWFSFNTPGGLGNALVYTGGQYGNAGENVHIPAPGALALLAMGAVGIRRKRKRAA